MKSITQTVFLTVLCFVIINLTACGGPPPTKPQQPDPQQEPTATQQLAAEQETEPTATPLPPPTEPPPEAPSEPESPETPPEQEAPETPPDLASAAEMLGITEQELVNALGPPPPDLAAAAQTLGITEETLQNAMFADGTTPDFVSESTESADSTPAESEASGTPPDLAAVAETLGITEQELKDALGPPPPDLAAAAQTLGIPEETLQNAMATAGGSDQAQPDAPPAETEVTETTTTPVEQPSVTADPTSANGYPLVDTGQISCYGDLNAITCPQSGVALDGQDAQYNNLQSSYVDNGDGTVTDNVTGLMWQKTPGDKMNYDQALAGANSSNLAGYDDWRVPTIKELYSLILFSGSDASTCTEVATCSAIPFIDTTYFDFEYGDTTIERVIDAQYLSSTKYVSLTMNRDETAFGVNMADGRIKGYGLVLHGSQKTFFVLYVRGNPAYGLNNFVDNGNGTITDLATGLTWSQNDSGTDLAWADALAYCENLTSGGHDDWRLPNAKELQSLVDYTRSPATTNSAAINPLFTVSSIVNEGGDNDYPYYWSSTTHVNIMPEGGTAGGNVAYLSFGQALGYMDNAWHDVHGAGAQRSDPKIGDPADYPTGHGPQGDAIRVYNYARCARDGGVVAVDRTNEVPDQSSGSPPDLAAAAATLGVTEQALKDALGPPPPDLAAAAATLGVTEQALQDALGVSGP